MIPHRRAALAGLGALALGGCASAGGRPEPLAEPAFDPQTWFAGRTDAYGLFEAVGRARFGFRTWLEGAPAAGGGGAWTLRERFLYDTGERWERTWRFTPAGSGAWSATAENTVGAGVMRVEGSAARMRYLADMPSGGGLQRLGFDMRLNRVGAVVQNRSAVSKFGLPVGRLVMTFLKPGPQTADADAVGALAPFPVPHAR